MSQSNDRAITLALELLRGNETYIADARAGAPVGNSVVGSLLSLQHQVPRQYSERAVLEALRQLDMQAEREREMDEFEAEAERVRKGGAITLTRTGQAPLRFQGELLEERDGERWNGKENNRWHELAVYRTAKGAYVLRIAFRTKWQGELDHDTAEILAKPADVATALADYDPCKPVGGYPPGAVYKERQERLLRDIRRRYEALVSELLASAPEFAEEIA